MKDDGVGCGLLIVLTLLAGLIWVLGYRFDKLDDRLDRLENKIEERV